MIDQSLAELHIIADIFENAYSNGLVKNCYERERVKPVLTSNVIIFSALIKTAYILFPVEEATVAGALCKNEKFYTPTTTGNVLYLNANPDLQIVLEKVEQAGEKIMKPKTHISDIFFMALIEDTEGNRIALHSTQ